MICSEARLLANRRNAQKSTGPKTEEGKARSRANALKHGLCASVIVPEDAQLVQSRARDFFKTLRPQNHFHCWLVTEISLISIRIERCERTERRIRDKVAIRAELFWDDDKRLEASLLGEQLGNRPEVVVDQLRRTLHGVEWLMSRWAMLAHSADVKGGWTPSQTALAFDLLATPPEFREGHLPGASIDFEGRVIEGSSNPAEVARREISALKQRRELVEGLDEANQALAEADLNDDSDPELKRNRRYEGSLHRRLRWCLDQLRYQSPLHEPLRGLMGTWLGHEEPPPKLEVPKLPDRLPIPAPEPEPEITAGRFPDIHPPFDLTPEEAPEPGQRADIPRILANRRDQKLRRAEARRDSRRRKLDNLRA